MNFILAYRKGQDWCRVFVDYSIYELKITNYWDIPVSEGFDTFEEVIEEYKKNPARIPDVPVMSWHNKILLRCFDKDEKQYIEYEKILRNVWENYRHLI